MWTKDYTWYTQGDLPTTGAMGLYAWCPDMTDDGVGTNGGATGNGSQH